MSLSIRKANKGDYEPSLPLFRQVHELHVSERDRKKTYEICI